MLWPGGGEATCRGSVLKAEDNFCGPAVSAGIGAGISTGEFSIVGSG